MEGGKFLLPLSFLSRATNFLRENSIIEDMIHGGDGKSG
jgi:hypothetical protein